MLVLSECVSNFFIGIKIDYASFQLYFSTRAVFMDALHQLLPMACSGMLESGCIEYGIGQAIICFMKMQRPQDIYCGSLNMALHGHYQD